MPFRVSDTLTRALIHPGEVERILATQSAGLARVKGKRVRAVRVVVFEGEGEAVMRQIANSSTPGEHDLKWGTLTIVQGGIEVLGDVVEASGGASDG